MMNMPETVIMTPDFDKSVVLILSIITHPCSVAIFLGIGFVTFPDPQTRPPSGMDSNPTPVLFEMLSIYGWHGDWQVGMWGDGRTRKKGTILMSSTGNCWKQWEHLINSYPSHSHPHLQRMPDVKELQGTDMIVPLLYRKIWLSAAHIWACGTIYESYDLTPSLSFQLALSLLRFSHLYRETLHLPLSTLFLD